MNSECKHLIQAGFIWHFVNIIFFYKSYQMNYSQKVNLGASRDAQFCVGRDHESLCTTVDRKHCSNVLSQIQNKTNNSLLPYYCLIGITSMKLWAESCFWNRGREILIHTGIFTRQFWMWFCLKSSSESFNWTSKYWYFLFFFNKFYNGLSLLQNCLPFRENTEK